VSDAARYVLNGTMLALAWFAAVNALGSAAVAIAAERVMARLDRASSGAWFALRVLPAAAAVVFVAMLFVPSYWLLEPREGAERFDITLLVAASAAVAACAAAALRALTAWYRAAQRTRTWMQTARPFAMPGTTVAAFELDVDAPLLVLAGIVRPRLLVTRGLIAALTPDELAACVSHELAHWRSRDNLKRLAMRMVPDFLALSGAAGALDRRWAAAVEHRADRHASAHDPQARCALASALVKVARLTPPVVSAAEPISALVGGGDLATRVSRLLEERTSAHAASGRRRWMAAAIAVAAIVVLYGPLLDSIHEATEILIRVLP